MKKKLTKSSSNVVFTGTLGGLAEYWGIDANLVRVVYVLLSVFSTGFPGLLIYIILACVIQPGQTSKRSFSSYDSTNATTKNRKEAEKVNQDDWSDF